MQPGTARYEALENYLLELINEENVKIETEEDTVQAGLLIVELFTADFIALLDGYVRESHSFGRTPDAKELGN